MKKLTLNKETIAQLTNPDRIFGGEGAPYIGTAGGHTCVYNTCDGNTCNTCPTWADVCPTFDDKASCPIPYVACLTIHCPLFETAIEC